jgi:hypothetical protein
LSAKKKNGNNKSGHQAAPQVSAEDLWIAPKSNLKGDNGDRAWNDRTGAPTGSRLLELADIALGLKKPEPFKKRHSAAAAAGGDAHSSR